MMSPSKTERASKIDNAIAKQKLYYDSCCVVSGQRKGTDGCHIYPRDIYPHFADIPENILPAAHDFHVELDIFEDMDARIEFIECHILRDEYDWIYDKWQIQRELLFEIVESFRKENGGQIRWKHSKLRR